MSASSLRGVSSTGCSVWVVRTDRLCMEKVNQMKDALIGSTTRSWEAVMCAQSADPM